MLVLSRQRDETITIGDGIEVTVVDIRGNKVRLGINAPKGVPVHRKEVAEAIRKQSRCAATEAKAGQMADVSAAAGAACVPAEAEAGDDERSVR